MAEGRGDCVQSVQVAVAVDVSDVIVLNEEALMVQVLEIAQKDTCAFIKNAMQWTYPQKSVHLSWIYN